MKLRPSRLFKCFHVLRRFREAFASLFATQFTSLLGETSYFEAPYLESPSQDIIQLVYVGQHRMFTKFIKALIMSPSPLRHVLELLEFDGRYVV